MVTNLIFSILAMGSLTCDGEYDPLISTLANEPDMACYATAPDRASLPVRENYLALSPTVGRIKRGRVFWGQRVAGENKVLVYSPNISGPIGIARHSFTRQVNSSRCWNWDKLYAPGADEIMGWGEALTGAEPIPRSPTVSGSAGCYRLKTRQTPFWGTRDVTTSNAYKRRVQRRHSDGSVEKDYPLWAVVRLPRAACNTAD